MWTRQNISNVLLFRGICVIRFTKTNGEERTMFASSNVDIMEQYGFKHHVESGSHKNNTNVIKTWDCEAKDFRSFRISALKWILEGDFKTLQEATDAYNILATKNFSV